MKNILLSSLIATAMTVGLLFLFGFNNSSETAAISNAQINDNMPFGTIIAYAGPRANLESRGWLLCDGSSYFISDYPNLYNTIKKIWGHDNYPGNPNFKVPNLQGQFLRGSEYGASHINRNVDKSPRNRASGFAGHDIADNVGSYQKDYYKGHDHGGGRHNHGGGRHNHGYTDVYLNETHDRLPGNSTPIGPRTGSGSTDYNNGHGYYIYKRSENSVGTLIKESRVIALGTELETTPKNAGVHFYIKAK